MVSQVGEAINRSLNMAFKVTKAYNRTKILTIKNQDQEIDTWTAYEVNSHLLQ